MQGVMCMQQQAGKHNLHTLLEINKCPQCPDMHTVMSLQNNHMKNYCHWLTSHLYISILSFMVETSQFAFQAVTLWAIGHELLMAKMKDRRGPWTMDVCFCVSIHTL